MILHDPCQLHFPFFDIVAVAAGLAPPSCGVGKQETRGATTNRDLNDISHGKRTSDDIPTEAVRRRIPRGPERNTGGH